ncbi:MAG: hypothetical protein GY715_12460 [Planctomycetes bacterium]|nr:hypothetical protein [Planctomycetota bacterium]
MIDHTPKRRVLRRRRGAAYVLILAIATAVALIGLTALHVSHMQFRGASLTRDWSDAQTIAQAGIDTGLLAVANAIDAAEAANSDWRLQFDSDAPISPVTMGRGSYTWMVTDPDGNLLDDPTDAFEIVATGAVNTASYSLSARLQPDEPADPASSLGSALHAGGNLMINTATLTADGLVTSNGNVVASSAVVDADVEAVGLISGDAFGGATATGADARELPISWIFEQYVSRGTPIGIGSISSNRIRRKVLSPGRNPYGATNPLGIYVIDCGGQSLEIQGTRLVGTLVLLNAGPGTEISDTVTFEPALPDYPSLLVQGSIRIAPGPGHLDENAESTNYNPTDTPYKGHGDSDKNDLYPGVISGLVYVSGNVQIDGDVIIEGALIAGGSIAISGANVSVLYRDTFLNDAPPGFRVGPMPVRLVPGSLAQVIE